jgi:hypothetical protein
MLGGSMKQTPHVSGTREKVTEPGLNLYAESAIGRARENWLHAREIKAVDIRFFMTV